MAYQITYVPLGRCDCRICSSIYLFYLAWKVVCTLQVFKAWLVEHFFIEIGGLGEWRRTFVLSERSKNYETAAVSIWGWIHFGVPQKISVRQSSFSKTDLSRERDWVRLYIDWRILWDAEPTSIQIILTPIVKEIIKQFGVCLLIINISIICSVQSYPIDPLSSIDSYC